tara:strand:+ start:691 stop:870 length:180 start_codon:yes stop_codon:yes gene_type:complete
MMTFFNILFILIGANVVFMFFSLSGVSQKERKIVQENSEESSSKVYPIDLIPSKYKKAV